MTVKQIKKFIKDNKKEIIICGVGCIVGYKFGRRYITKEDMYIVRRMYKANRLKSNKDNPNTIQRDIINAAKDSKICNSFYDDNGKTFNFAEFNKKILDYYNVKGINPEVTGIIVFEK